MWIEYIVYKRIVIVIYAQIELEIVAALLFRMRMVAIMAMLMTTFVATVAFIISKVHRMCSSVIG